MDADLIRNVFLSSAQKDAYEKTTFRLNAMFHFFFPCGAWQGMEPRANSKHNVLHNVCSGRCITECSDHFNHPPGGTSTDTLLPLKAPS
jgi:hypothetical protein